MRAYAPGLRSSGATGIGTTAGAASGAGSAWAARRRARPDVTACIRNAK